MAKWHLPAQTAAVIDANTPESREILFDLTNFRARIGDGTTAGGKVLAFQSDLDGLISTAMSPVVTASTALLGFVALGVPTSFATALASLSSGASLTDVIEAFTINDYGDARWASLTENNAFEGTQTAPSFTATLADDNATLRALRTGTSTVDTRIRAGATQGQFGTWTLHKLEIVINGAKVAQVETSGAWSLDYALTATGLTANVSGADATVRANRQSGADGRIVAGASTVELGSYSADPVLLMYNGVEQIRIDPSGNLDFSAIGGKAIGLGAPTANGHAARYQEIRPPLQFSTGADTVGSGATAYAGLGDTSAASDVVSIPITRNGTLRNMYVTFSGSPGTSESFTVTLMVNGVATALTCTISDTNRRAADTSNSVAVTAGQYADVRIVASGAANARQAQITLEYAL